MNISNQLLLGIVFITAGIAMALLAYAAFLNREDDGEAELAEPEADEGEQVDVGEMPLADEPEADPSAETVAAAVPEPVTPAPPPVQAEAPETISPEPEQPAPAMAVQAPAAVPANANLRRDERTGRLVIEVDSTVYRSMSELRASGDWNRVDGLFSDLIAWLYPNEPPSRPVEEPGPSEAEVVDEGPPSMIDQINMILKETLADRSDGPQAVRLMEGTGGTIRVMIGVKSYRLEDVPDERVKRVIRQAVSEWESRS